MVFVHVLGNHCHKSKLVRSVETTLVVDAKLVWLKMRKNLGSTFHKCRVGLLSVGHQDKAAVPRQAVTAADSHHLL